MRLFGLGWVLTLQSCAGCLGSTCVYCTVYTELILYLLTPVLLLLVKTFSIMSHTIYTHSALLILTYENLKMVKAFSTLF